MHNIQHNTQYNSNPQYIHNRPRVSKLSFLKGARSDDVDTPGGRMLHIYIYIYKEREMCLEHTMCNIAVQLNTVLMDAFSWFSLLYYQEKSIDLLCWCLFEVIPAERAESSWLRFKGFFI